MSALPRNIIEIQSALQNPVNVTMEDLVKYVNESNPEVPPFLALIEMNRRKAMQQKPEEGGPQGTVKDQTINALMGRPQVNPAAAPPGVNPAAAPQMVNPTMQAQQVMPQQAPPQVNPGAMVQAARGGLMSIPVKMFNAKNYAGGGIVAFAKGGDAEDEFTESSTGLNVLKSEEERQSPARAQYTLGDREIPRVRSLEEIQAGLPALTPMRPRPAEMTIEQAAQRNKDIRKAAGVSEDPYAEANEFQKGIEERQAKERENDPVDRLIAMARAFAKADPTSGFGAQAAAASDASSSLEATQRAIRERQDAVSRDFRLSSAREEDARRRGDATGIAAALKEKEREQAEYDKLQFEFDKAEQAKVKTAVDIQQAENTQAKLPIDLYNAERQAKLVDAQIGNYKTLQDERKAKRAEDAGNKETPAEKAYAKKNAQFKQEPYILNLMKDLSSGGLDPETKAERVREYNRHKRAYFAAEVAQFPNLKLPLLDETPDVPTKPPPGPSFMQRMGESARNAVAGGLGALSMSPMGLPRPNATPQQAPQQTPAAQKQVLVPYDQLPLARK